MSKLYIEVEGGLIGTVWVRHNDEPMTVCIIDHDTEGMEDSEIAEYKEKVKELDYLRDHAEVEEIY